MFTWIPTYLKTERDLTVVGTSGYLFVVIAGAFLGYLTAGFVHDRLGRGARRSRCSRRWRASSLVAYFLVPSGLEHDAADRRLPARLLRLGLLLGLRLLPGRAVPDARARRPAGASVTTSAAAIGALFPGIIGFLAAAIGLGGAVAFGVFGYVLAIAALPLLPETHGESSRRRVTRSRRAARARGPTTSSSRATPARRCGRRTSRACC